MRPLLHWVSEKEFQEHEGWFQNYLGRNGLLPHGYPRCDYYTSAKVCIDRWTNYLASEHQRDPAHIELIIKRMKNAWTQRIRRLKSPHDKAYCFFMSKKVQGQLRYLAMTAGGSTNKTLEQLILDASVYVKELTAKHQAEIKQLKEKHREDIRRTRESYARKFPKPSHITHENGMATEQQRGSEPTQVNMGVTVEELEKLFSAVINRKINEMRFSQNEQLGATPQDDGLTPEEQSTPGHTAPNTNNASTTLQADCPETLTPPVVESSPNRPNPPTQTEHLIATGQILTDTPPADPKLDPDGQEGSPHAAQPQPSSTGIQLE